MNFVHSFSLTHLEAGACFEGKIAHQNIGRGSSKRAAIGIFSRLEDDAIIAGVKGRVFEQNTTRRVDVDPVSVGTEEQLIVVGAERSSRKQSRSVFKFKD